MSKKEITEKLKGLTPEEKIELLNNDTFSIVVYSECYQKPYFISDDANEDNIILNLGDYEICEYTTNVEITMPDGEIVTLDSIEELEQLLGVKYN